MDGGSEMSLVDRVLGTLEQRRDNVLNGNINCIPFPFPRFRDDIPGIEKGRYTIVTGATKSSKTQFASFLYIYYPLIYAYEHPEQLRVRIFYFPLEETQEQVLTRFASYLLYRLSKGKYRISPVDLNSTDKDKPLSREILDVLHSDEYMKMFRFFEEHVTFSSSTNPTGIWKTCRDYAVSHGTVHCREAHYVDDNGVLQTTKNAFDWYEEEDPLEYRIAFVDHASLISPEKNQDLRGAISKLSEYLMDIRNKYRFSPVLVQQQAMFETLDAYKMDMLEPSIANLADNKATSRDADMCISMFSPYKYNLPSYKTGTEVYDITKLKDSIRFMKCIINRNGQSNGVLPLYFDGACNWFSEMPHANDTQKMQNVYNHIAKIKSSKTGILFLNIIRKLKNTV